MKNILVAVDFTGTADLLLAKAEEMAKLCDAKVWLVHVAPPLPDFVGYEVGPKYIRDHRAKELRHEHRDIQKMAKFLESKNVKVEPLLVEGQTVETILQEAEKLQTDLIIIATRKHGFLYEQFVGSTFKDVAAQSKIPILAIPVHENRAKKAMEN